MRQLNIQPSYSDPGEPEALNRASGFGGASPYRPGLMAVNSANEMSTSRSAANLLERPGRNSATSPFRRQMELGGHLEHRFAGRGTTRVQLLDIDPEGGERARDMTDDTGTVPGP